MEPHEPGGIEFFVDEMLPIRRMATFIEGRGHILRQVTLKEKDPAILRTAEGVGAVVVTSDRYFCQQIHPRAPGRRSAFRRAGIVLIPGEWEAAEPLIGEWMPVIEAAHRVLQGRADKRLVFAFEPGQSRIVIDNDPDLTVVTRLRHLGIVSQ